MISPESRKHWSHARPWQTNLAFILIGFAMICLTRQLISENDHFTLGLSGVSSSSLGLYLAAVFIFLIKPANTDRFTLPIIFTFAIACRLVGLFPDPFLSSDVYRYAWDGVVQHAHINPFLYVPADPHLAFLRAPNIDLYENMNRKDYAHTIYPPIAQAFFYLITFISPTVTGMKMAMILFEGLTVYGLSLLLRELHRSQTWLLLYAWNPLCIWEFGSSGHVDAMVIAFLVFAFLFRLRRQPVLTGLFLALAVLTKFYPVVLFPALYQRRSGGRLDWKMPATMAAVGIVAYLPYLSAGKLVFGFLGGYAREEGMTSGTRYFLLEDLQRLPGLHTLPGWVFLAFAAIVFLSLTLWTWRTSCSPNSRPAAFLLPAMCVALTLMLLFSPHYPWYVAWLVPFLVLAPSLTVFTYVGALFYLCTTQYATGTGAPQFHLNEMLYATVGFALIIEVTLYSIPRTRTWLRHHAPYAFCYESFSTRTTRS